MYRTAILAVLLLSIAGILLAGCAPSGQANASHDGMEMAPVSALPAHIQQAPGTVRTAYQFAVANPDALRNVPCYCGCGAMGHTSNLSCYLKDNQPADKPAFDDHALGCSICVDIALDVMRMTEQNRPPAEIRQEIVATYARFGPPNQ